MESYIVADVGGTNIRAAVFPKDGTQAVTTRKIATISPGQTPFERLVNLIHEIWPASNEVHSIVVAVPGSLDPNKGFIFDATNIPGWFNYPIGDMLRKEFPVPVMIGNDANLAALGEWRFGAGVGFHNLLYLTISTGIGGEVILNDQLLLGEHGLATEFGHVTVVPDGPMCNCGRRGHLEALASGTAIARFVKDNIALGAVSSLRSRTDITARDVAEAAILGDPLAAQAMQQAGTYIGYALADFLHLFNPAIVILGGGVSASGDCLINPIKAALPERIMDRGYIQELEITPARLGDDAGLMGALALSESLVIA